MWGVRLTMDPYLCLFNLLYVMRLHAKATTNPGAVLFGYTGMFINSIAFYYLETRQVYVGV